MALGNEPQTLLKDTNPMSWSQEPRGKELNPELGSGHLGRRSRESPEQCSAQVWAEQVWRGAGKITW